MDPVLHIGLMAFLILGSVVALEVRNLLSAVIALGVVGLGLSILFLLLSAPDIAITQVVVEVIVVTVLIRTATRVDAEPVGRRRDKVAVICGLGLVLVLLGFSLYVFASLPMFGQPPMELGSWYLENGAQDTGASNIVTAILLDYRAYDTLGEATVILTAVLGAMVVLRSRAKRKLASAPEPPAAPAGDAQDPQTAEVSHG